MANCQDDRLTGNNCCCQHCLHDRITNPECCRCVPRRVCWTYQDDDNFERPFIKIFEHEGDGVYTPLEITEGGSPPYFTDLQLVIDDEGECVWRLRKGTTADFTTILQSYDFPISWPDTKCLTNNDLFAVAEDWNHFGSNGDVTLKITPYILVPTEEVSPGEVEPVCDSCNCFDDCFCLELLVVTTIPDPDGGPDDYEGMRRTARVCFDEEDGPYGGWKYVFPLDTENTDCTYRHELLIEIGKDPQSASGTCQWLLTDDLEYFDRAVSPYGVNCGNGIFARWKYQISPLVKLQITASSGNCEDT